jgi:hypothetical protein
MIIPVFNLGYTQDNCVTTGITLALHVNFIIFCDI